MASAPLPNAVGESDARVRLTHDVCRVAWTLWGRAFNSADATGRLTIDQADDLTLEARIAAGDREAIYDSIVEAREQLDQLREQIGNLLVESTETLDRMHELRKAKDRHGEKRPPLVRWTPETTRARKRGG